MRVGASPSTVPAGRHAPPVALLTAVVRKKLGLTLVSEKTGEERLYRIVTKDAVSKRKGKSGRKAA